MRRASWGSALVIGLTVSALAGFALRDSALAEPHGIGTPSQGGELIALSADAESQQQVTVIDARSRVMSVYHIEHATGAITLRSVRSIEADLMMDEFNTSSPLPREIRAMLTTR